MNIRSAAEYLGITPKTLYKWKRQARANHGLLFFNGTPVQFRFRQTGAVGQGRIFFEQQWLDDLKVAMECQRETPRSKRKLVTKNIHVPLGVPQD